MKSNEKLNPTYVGVLMVVALAVAYGVIAMIFVTTSGCVDEIKRQPPIEEGLEVEGTETDPTCEVVANGTGAPLCPIDNPIGNPGSERTPGDELPTLEEACAGSLYLLDRVWTLEYTDMILNPVEIWFEGGVDVDGSCSVILHGDNKNYLIDGSVKCSEHLKTEDGRDTLLFDITGIFTGADGWYYEVEYIGTSEQVETYFVYDGVYDMIKVWERLPDGTPFYHHLFLGDYDPECEFNSTCE